MSFALACIWKKLTSDVSPWLQLSPAHMTRAAPVHHSDGSVLGGSVLAVTAGNVSVRNLSEPITLFFRHDNEVKMHKHGTAGIILRNFNHLLFSFSQTGNGTCVFWEESATGTGIIPGVSPWCFYSESNSDMFIHYVGLLQRSLERQRLQDQ